MAKCRLCAFDRPLCKSHIYPEFLYKPTYDEKGRALYVDSLAEGKPPFVQKGLRDQLLCDECETAFSRIESYFKKIWFDEGRIPAVLNEDFLVVENFEYQKFKLFLLSILWRASVATTEPFRQVSLGPHEQRIREFIQQETAPPPAQYQVFGRILVSRLDNQVSREFLVSPRRIKLGRLHAYEMAFGSVSWVCVVSNETRPDLEDLSLQDPGRIILTRLFVSDYDAAVNLNRSGRLDGF